MSVENPFAKARAKANRRQKSRGFFGETLTGQLYEAKDEIPKIDDFQWCNSDDGSDGFEDIGQLRVHFNKSDEKSKPKYVRNYLLGALLGEGAYAKVKEGLDVNSLRIVAVKIIDKKHVAKIKDGMENVKREIAIMKSMKKHPNLIELIEVMDEEAERKIYIVLELANGCSLQELLESTPDQRLPEPQVRHYFRQLMMGLRHLHGKNVVHRDIKPANLMLTTEHELKVSDFGVAEFLDKYTASAFVTKSSGSPAFLAPEIATGQYNFSGMAVDVWAAGVTLFFALVGRLPFQAENVLALFAKIREGKYEMPDFVDPDAQDLIAKMLNLDAEKRISASAVLKHPWLMVKSNRGTSDFVKIEMRDIEVIKTLATLSEDEDDQQQVPESTETLEETVEENAVASWYQDYSIYKFLKRWKGRWFGEDIQCVVS
eukprot:Plantae.Rhodophyta-Purpureofilum_apyrenoidigerum.ctg17027.p1 GENE.Plantae.Rhodophyta-Purpureofilum_apyrenoidigerum.ctg17027~~Plantae.Rhodophyta-Purpureofilum_apyrenoidigerum.ctg17027.p1  ORF type:complete len:429 (+),score=109.90 Plantae.Rhodophyta-Purpureofilum_apyrenoidigerum.ctg17027:91-1377(+)